MKTIDSMLGGNWLVELVAFNNISVIFCDMEINKISKPLKSTQ